MSDTTDRLRQTVSHATPGPWLLRSYEDFAGEGVRTTGRDWVCEPPIPYENVGLSAPDADYVARFDPVLVAAILDVIDAADQAAEAMDDVFSEVGGRAGSHHWRKASALEYALARFREVAGE